MDKTALALNIAQNVALRGAGKDEAPKRVAFFSLEISRDQLARELNVPVLALSQLSRSVETRQVKKPMLQICANPNP